MKFFKKETFYLENKYIKFHLYSWKGLSLYEVCYDCPFLNNRALCTYKNRGPSCVYCVEKLDVILSETKYKRFWK